MAGMYSEPIHAVGLSYNRAIRLAKSRQGRTNWGIFLWCWRITWTRHMVQVMTPWVVLSVASGASDWGSNVGVISTGTYWHGIRLAWGHVPHWDVGDGGLLFSKSDNSLSFQTRDLQETY